jgi:hypothetical protein
MLLSDARENNAKNDDRQVDDSNAEWQRARTWLTYKKKKRLGIFEQLLVPSIKCPFYLTKTCDIP